MLQTLINIQTPVPVLLVPRGAHALVAPLCVDAVMLAVVLPCRALVQVLAGPPVPVQLIAWRAPTPVGPECVVALVLTRTRDL